MYDKLRIAVQTGKVVDDVQMLIKLVQSSGALDYCKARALEETKTLNTPLIIYPTTVIVRGYIYLPSLPVLVLYRF